MGFRVPAAAPAAGRGERAGATARHQQQHQRLNILKKSSSQVNLLLSEGGPPKMVIMLPMTTENRSSTATVCQTPCSLPSTIHKAGSCTSPGGTMFTGTRTSLLHLGVELPCKGKAICKLNMHATPAHQPHLSSMLGGKKRPHIVNLATMFSFPASVVTGRHPP